MLSVSVLCVFRACSGVLAGVRRASATELGLAGHRAGGLLERGFRLDTARGHQRYRTPALRTSQSMSIGCVLTVSMPMFSAGHLLFTQNHCPISVPCVNVKPSNVFRNSL